MSNRILPNRIINCYSLLIVSTIIYFYFEFLQQLGIDRLEWNSVLIIIWTASHYLCLYLKKSITSFSELFYTFIVNCALILAHHSWIYSAVNNQTYVALFPLVYAIGIIILEYAHSRVFANLSTEIQPTNFIQITMTCLLCHFSRSNLSYESTSNFGTNNVLFLIYLLLLNLSFRIIHNAFHRQYTRNNLYTNSYALLRDGLIMAAPATVFLLVALATRTSHVIALDLVFAVLQTHSKYATKYMTFMYFYEFDILIHLLDNKFADNIESDHDPAQTPSYRLFGTIGDATIQEYLKAIKKAGERIKIRNNVSTHFVAKGIKGICTPNRMENLSYQNDATLVIGDTSYHVPKEMERIHQQVLQAFISSKIPIEPPKRQQRLLGLIMMVYYTYPHATAKHLYVISLYFVYLFLIDDVFDNHLGDIEDIVKKALQVVKEGKGEAISSPRLQAIWNFGDMVRLELNQMNPPSKWLDHFHETIGDYLHLGVHALHMARGREISMDDYIKMRRFDSAAFTVEPFVQLTGGFISEPYKNNPDYQEYLNDWVEHIALVNDVYSYHKEVALTKNKNAHNMLTFYEKVNFNLDKSVHDVVEKINQIELRMRDLEEKILLKSPEDMNLCSYFMNMRNFLTGHVRYYEQCVSQPTWGRYCDPSSPPETHTEEPMLH